MKNSSNDEIKNRAKNTSKNHENEKHCNTRYEMTLLKHTNVLMQIKSLQGVETATTSSHSLEDWRDLSLSLLSSLTP
jgi:hypothetical protein